MLVSSLSAVCDGGRRRFVERLASEHSFVSVCSRHDLGLCESLPSYVVRVVTAGTVALSIDDQARNLTSQTYVVTNPGQCVTLTSATDDAQVLLVSLTVSCVRSAHRAMRGSAQRILHDDSKAAHWPVGFKNRVCGRRDSVSPVLDDLQRIVELGVQDAMWLTRQYGVLSERLLFDEYRHSRRSDSLRSGSNLGARLDRTRRYMEDHFDQPLDLTQLAGLSAVSVHYFLRQFKKRFGKTPHRFLVDVRLREACNLLRASSLSVSEVGQRVGFVSANGFHSAFRKRYGCAPAQLRVPQEPAPAPVAPEPIRPALPGPSLWSLD